MKLERLHESVLPTVVVGGGLLLAIYAGSAAGTGRTGTVGLIIAAILGIAFLLIARERIWMIIPATWMLSGKISVLPLPFSIAQLATLFAFGVFLLLKAFKIVRFKPKIGFVDIWMMLVLGYLVTVFLRNPVGVDALGSDRVGGKPYFNVVVAVCAYWVLSRVVASTREAFWVPLLGVAGYAFDTLLNAIAYRYPWTAAPLARLYSNIAAAEDLEASSAFAMDYNRKAYLQGIAISLFSYACARWRPFTIINPFYFGRFLLTAIAFYAVFQSGFRSALFGMMLMFLMSTFFRRGWVEVLKGFFVGCLALGLLVGMQGTIITLPFAAQRALSFLPGKWDYMASNEAAGSTEWRVEMWKQMLTGNKYIANKWLGDGFGFTRQQLQIMAANTQTGTNADQQENLMISGGVHSGPVSTIRYVGYVGLAIYIILLILMAIHSWRLIRRAEGTPFFTLALLVGIPVITHPFTFVVIFGAYEGDLPNMILSLGMLKMLENSLEAYVPEAKQSPEVVLTSPKFRRPLQYSPAGRVG